MTYSQADITVPYAVANIAEIRHKGYYYVDKTNYIPLLERYKIGRASCRERVYMPV